MCFLCASEHCHFLNGMNKVLCIVHSEFCVHQGSFSMTCFQYPGPDERGLKFQRDMTMEFPRVVSGWMGPFFPVIMVHHPENVRLILKTSGRML